MTDPYLPHHGDLRFAVRRYELELDYRPSTNALSGRAVLRVELLESTDTVVLDLVAALAVSKVLVAGRAAHYRHRGHRLTVRLDDEQPAGAALAVEVRWSGGPGPQRGPWGETGWEELTDGVLVAGQPDGAPTWFPCNDRPGDKASYRTTVRTDAAYTVVGNGRLVSRTPSGSRVTWVHEQAEPTATYLVTLHIGRYVTTEVAGQLLHAPPELLDRARADTARQPQMAALFARLFGDYPFVAPYAVVVTADDLEIPLEAQGLSVFGANHMDGRGGCERLVAHELAHQWFGNSLTAASWRDIWLHEGFACYAEWLWSEEAGGPSAHEKALAAHARLAQLPQDLVLADPSPALMFDDRVYKRGALTLHALRRQVGDERFFDLLRGWTAAHRHRSVTTEAFRAHVGQASLLSAWLDERPLPLLR